MSETIRFVIQPEQLPGLGHLVPGTKSRVSPLEYGRPRALSDVDLEDLRKNRILDTDGQISRPLRSTLDLIAVARAYTRIRFSAGIELLEVIVYFAPDGNRSVALTNTERGLVVEDPAPVDSILGTLRAYTGGSILRVCEFDQRLGVEETLALAALIDLRRKSALRAFVDGDTFVPDAFEIHVIHQAVAETPSNPQWLVSIVRDMVGTDIRISEMSIQRAVTDLMAADLVERVGSHFKLAETASILGGRFLVFDNLLNLSVGREGDGGEIIVIGFTCLQAGVHELLSLDYSADRFQVTTLSSEALLETVGHFLENGDALADMAAEYAKEQNVGATPAITSLSTWEVTVTTREGASKALPLGELVSIGRDASNDICLSDGSVSRRHALLKRMEFGYLITDQGSSNGTYVNGVRIKQPTMLYNGDTVTVGETKLTLVSQPELDSDATRNITICPVCGAHIAAGLKRCLECGTSLS